MWNLYFGLFNLGVGIGGYSSDDSTIFVLSFVLILSAPILIIFGIKDIIENALKKNNKN